MKTFFILSALMAFLFISCEKESSTAERDRFIGTYTGTQTVTFYFDGTIQSTNTYAGTETISAGSADDEILIGKSSEMQLSGSVTGSSVFIASQPEQIDNGDGTYSTATVTGSGVLLDSGALTLNFQATGTYKGHSFKYVYVESVSKDK